MLTLKKQQTNTIIPFKCIGCGGYFENGGRIFLKIKHNDRRDESYNAVEIREESVESHRFLENDQVIPIVLLSVEYRAR